MRGENTHDLQITVWTKTLEQLSLYSHRYLASPSSFKMQDLKGIHFKMENYDRGGVAFKK